MLEQVFVGVLLRHVTELQKVLRLQLTRLVPGDVPLDQAADLWAAYDAIERHAAAAKTLLAARVDESRAWARAGARSPEEHLARRSGTSTGAARRRLACSKALPKLPATEAALRRGELSQAQAETIADAAAVNPAAERSLLDAAATSTLVQLRESAGRAKAAGDPDPDATHRRLHRERRVRRYTDSQGAWNLQARGTADAGAAFNAALDPVIDEIFREAHREGRTEPRDAYAFDALIRLARGGRDGTRADARADDAGEAVTDANGAASPGDVSTHPGAPAARASDATPVSDATSDPSTDPDGPVDHARSDVPASPSDATATDAEELTAGPSGPVDSESQASSTATRSGRAARPRPPNPSFLALLRVDLEALVRGRVEGDELCEIAGVGPVPARVARDLLGDAIVKLVITKGTDVANVTHLGRGPTAAQRIALLWANPDCTNTRCTNTLAIQHDHRRPWVERKETRVDNIDRLCAPCHRHKTHDGWALVPGTGPRPLVPPDDPRHPRSSVDSTDTVKGVEPPAGDVAPAAAPAGPPQQLFPGVDAA